MPTRGDPFDHSLMAGWILVERWVAEPEIIYIHTRSGSRFLPHTPCLRRFANVPSDSGDAGIFSPHAQPPNLGVAKGLFGDEARKKEAPAWTAHVLSENSGEVNATCSMEKRSRDTNTC